MKKGILAVSLVAVVLTACAKPTSTKENTLVTSDTTKAVTTTEAVTENVTEASTEVVQPVINVPSSIDFVSARGEWYKVDVNKTWPLHSYKTECFKRTDEKMAYTGEGYTYRLGIDVSKYQGYIDWNAVKSDGYEFAIVRMGYRGYGPAGTLVADDMAISNIKGAIASGMDAGAYFFSQAVTEEEAIAEANYVLGILKDAGIGNDMLKMPIVYDVEHILDDEARTDNVSGEQFTKNAIAFMETVKASGYDTMFYSNMLWEAYQFDLERLKNYKLWYADYESIPQTPYSFDFWQYSEKGRVAGIQGACDLDIEIIKK